MFATSKLGSGTPATAKQRLEEALARKPKSFEPTGADIKQISTIVRQKARKDLEELEL